MLAALLTADLAAEATDEEAVELTFATELLTELETFEAALVTAALAFEADELTELETDRTA